MEITPDEWRYIYDLRNDLDDEDRAAMRKLILYTEHLERVVREAHKTLSRAKVKELRRSNHE